MKLTEEEHKRERALNILRKYEDRPTGYTEHEIINAMIEFEYKEGHNKVMKDLLKWMSTEPDFNIRGNDDVYEILADYQFYKNSQNTHLGL